MAWGVPLFVLGHLGYWLLPPKAFSILRVGKEHATLCLAHRPVAC